MQSFQEQELLFAKNFPYSKTALKIVKQQGFELSQVSEQLLQRSKLMILSAFKKQEYEARIKETADLMLNEVLAFPIAKILLSFINNYSLNERFASMIAESTFNALSAESKALLDLASELEMKFELHDGFFASVSLTDFIAVPKSFQFLHLVNAKVSKGRVFLDRNEFLHFLSENVKKIVLQSLPVNTKGIPEKFSKFAAGIARQLLSTQRQGIQEFAGELNFQAFPPCFAELYSRISSGSKLAHLGNFSLAAFLIAVGMPKQQILEVYSKASNYNEKIAKYHIERMTGKAKRYTPASCNTMRSYQLCVQNGLLCPNTRNPLQYYKRKVFSSSRKASVEDNEVENSVKSVGKK